MNNRLELGHHFRDLGFKVGAEIGVYKGRYSHTLFKIIPGLKLYSVDSWEGKYKNSEEAARLSLSRHPNSVIIKGDSKEVAKTFEDNSLDFVYIDGDHTYNGAMTDIVSWTPKVRSGGIVSGHDYQLPDVRSAVDDYVRKHSIQLFITKQDAVKEHPSWFFVK